jgi:hypothetical protein
MFGITVYVYDIGIGSHNTAIMQDLVFLTTFLMKHFGMLRGVKW